MAGEHRRTRCTRAYCGTLYNVSDVGAVKFTVRTAETIEKRLTCSIECAVKELDEIRKKLLHYRTVRE